MSFCSSCGPAGSADALSFSAPQRSLLARVHELVKFESPSEEQRLVAGLRWIGLFSSTERVTPRGNLLDTLCATLEAKMQYEAGERDMVMLQHKFEIVNKDGSEVSPPRFSCPAVALDPGSLRPHN